MKTQNKLLPIKLDYKKTVATYFFFFEKKKTKFIYDSKINIKVNFLAILFFHVTFSNEQENSIWSCKAVVADWGKPSISQHESCASNPNWVVFRRVSVYLSPQNGTVCGNIDDIILFDVSSCFE